MFAQSPRVQAALNSLLALAHLPGTELLGGEDCSHLHLTSEKTEQRGQQLSKVTLGISGSQAVWLQSTGSEPLPHSATEAPLGGWGLGQKQPKAASSDLLDSPGPSGRRLSIPSQVRMLLTCPFKPKPSELQALKGSLSSRDKAADAKPQGVGCGPGTWFGSRTS